MKLAQINGDCMTISKTETHGITDDVISVYIRLPRENAQKAVNRFKNSLRESINIGKDDLPKGVIGQTTDASRYDNQSVSGEGTFINITKSENYVHIVAVLLKKNMPEFRKAMEFLK